MKQQLINEFEEARCLYTDAVALVEVMILESEHWYESHGITKEIRRTWVCGDAEMPSALAEIESATMEAMRLRREAYGKLIDAAQQITSVIARKHGRGAAELNLVFEHMRQRPYSPASQKALDAILRLDARL
jgi:hypothetical protein